MGKVQKIDVGTKVRSIGLFVALLNQALAVYGYSPLPFNDELITNVVSMVLVGVTSLWAWWKDNDITKKARNYKKPKKKFRR